MSNNPGGKTLSFISGILIGIISGLGLFFILIIGFNPLSIFKDSDTSEAQDTLVDLRKNPISTNAKTKKQQSESDITKISEIELDTLSSNEQTDTSSNSTLNVSDLNSEEIIVKRDELIDTRILKISIVNKALSKGKADSLVSVFQGSSTHTSEYRIEFWRSPINYRGFKFIRNTLVTFGLDSNESSRLFLLDEVFYLKHGISVYRLFTTEKFEPFTKITDDNIIKQLR